MDTLLKVESPPESMRCTHCGRSFQAGELKRDEVKGKTKEYVRRDGRVCRRPSYEYECWINTFIDGRRIPSCVEMLYVWRLDSEDIKPILGALGVEIDG